MARVTVRYIVDDVDAAIEFYAKHLGFHEDMHPAPTFAMLSRGDLRLALSAPGGPGRRWTSDARRPCARTRGMEPLLARGAGPGGCGGRPAAGGRALPERHRAWRRGKQVLIDDPSGNPVELFEPAPR
jgi:catechol 2,3-dioxygenase-like lactoylglutathione lyase family enzyme